MKAELTGMFFAVDRTGMCASFHVGVICDFLIWLCVSVYVVCVCVCVCVRVWIQKSRKTRSAGVSSSHLYTSSQSQSSAVVCGDSEAVTMTTVCQSRRRTIPQRPNYSINLWSIMKNCIGKELSKIPMPVCCQDILFSLCTSVLLSLAIPYRSVHWVHHGASCLMA